jgi:Transposase, Mutator family
MYEKIRVEHGVEPQHWQRCMVHFYRNVFSHVPATRVHEVSHMLKTIHAQESRDAADRKARMIVEDLRAAKMFTAADPVERSVSETLTYYAFPTILRRTSGRFSNTPTSRTSPPRPLSAIATQTVASCTSNPTRPALHA